MRNLLSAEKSIALRSIVLLAVLTSTLSACSGWRSRTDYRAAQNSKALEIPEGLDSPDSMSAIAIPEVTGEPSLDGAEAPVAMDAPGVQQDRYNPEAAPVFESLRVADDFANVFKRAVLALERAKVGEIANRNPEAGTITLNDYVAVTQKRGFFKRLFGRSDAVQTISRVVRITADGDASVIAIEDGSGRPTNDGFAQRVMGTLKARLAE